MMVECKDCGFLAFREKGTFQLVEAGLELRETGKIPTVREAIGPTHHLMIPVPIFEKHPLCFVRAHDLQSEWVDGVEDEEGINEIIGKPRECAAFYGWKQGYAPKEHAEMMREEKLIEWHDKQSSEARRSSRLSLAVAVVSVLIAAAVGAANFLKPNAPPVVNLNLPQQPAPVVNVQLPEAKPQSIDQSAKP